MMSWWRQFLADRTACSMIGYLHNTVVCLSVCLRRCLLWLNDTSYSKREQKVLLLRTLFCNFHPYTDPERPKITPHTDRTEVVHQNKHASKQTSV